VRSTLRRSLVLSGAAIAAAAAVTAMPVGAAPASAAAPALGLVSAAPHVTYHRFPGDPIFFFDLGMHLQAGPSPVEIRASRPSFDRPVKASRVTRTGNRETLTPLPAGLVQDMYGLSSFLHIRMTGTDGRVVMDKDTTFCLNSFLAVRSRPDAPATSPYPEMCGTYAPFAQGGVWGLQAGWSEQLILDTFDQGVDTPDGDYTIDVSINPAYRSFFAIPAEAARVSTTFTVETIDVDDPPSTTAPGQPGAAAAAAPAAGSGAHAVAAAELARARTARGRGGLTLHLDGTAPRLPERAGSGPALKPAGTRPTATRVRPANTRPDLRAVPAFGITATNEDGADQLVFAANVWNAGPSPLIVDGFRRAGTDLMDAVQYFYDADGREVGSAPTGTFEFDRRPGHDHWHFTDFATYRLLDASQQLAVRSGKEAFCLGATDPIDLLVRGALWKPGTFGFSNCAGETALAIREQLPVGWGDTYIQSLPGQAFDITGVPNGTYYIQVVANPENRLYESSSTNNTSLRKVILGGTPGARTVQVPPVGLIDVP
jgi:Lysyl oxidase